MRNVAKTVVLVFISIAGGSARVNAQAQSGAPSNSIPIAVIDVTTVFMNHAGFKQRMDIMRADVTAFGKQMMEERQAITKGRERLQALTPGSPEFKKLEEELARQISDLEVRNNLKRKDVMELEAKIYFETYKDIVRETAKMADAYGINLVLKYEGRPIDARDHNAIRLALDRPILYQRNLDLTQAVLKQINGTSLPPSNTEQAMRPTGPATSAPGTGPQRMGAPAGGAPTGGAPARFR